MLLLWWWWWWWCLPFDYKLPPVGVFLLCLRKNLSFILKIKVKGAAGNFYHLWCQLRRRGYPIFWFYNNLYAHRCGGRRRGGSGGRGSGGRGGCGGVEVRRGPLRWWAGGAVGGLADARVEGRATAPAASAVGAGARPAAEFVVHQRRRGGWWWWRGRRAIDRSGARGLDGGYSDGAESCSSS